MAITPQDIEQMTFSEAKKHGYSTEEVDAFLDQLSGEVDAMLKKIADLKGRLTSAEQQLASSEAQTAQLREQLDQAAHAPIPQAAPVATTSVSSASEEQISRVLIVAQQSADKLLADARDNAEHVRNEADQKAREVIRQALAEKQNELDEIDRLKQSREDFRSEYKKLLQHFMDDADAVFPEQPLTSSAKPQTTPRETPKPQSPAPKADAGATVYAPQQGGSAPTDFSDLD